MPDSLQLGHAKVVLDNSIASGSITRNGGFVMCVCVARVPHVVKKTGIQLADAPTPPTAQTSQRGRTSSLLYPTTMSLTRSVCAFSSSSTLALPLNGMPAVPCRRSYRTWIPSRSASLHCRHTAEPALAHQTALPRQARSTAEEELLYSTSILQHHGDAPESHDAHHGFRRPDDARDALCYGEHVVDILSFFPP